MKYFLRFVVVFVFCVSGFHVRAEEISNFNSILLVQKDGLVIVTETIDYNFDITPRHGIFRILETKHPQEATAWYKKRTIDITVTGVKRDGRSELYQVTEKGNAIEVKIGNPDATITGAHTYTISYTLRGALSSGNQGSEFYYNVTGNEWEVSIARASAMVIDTTGTLFASASDCYRGTQGETTRCTKGQKTATSTTFSTDLLPAGSGLTIAQELKQSEVAILINETVSVSWLGYVLGLVWLLGLSVWAYRFRTQFKSNKPVVAQYEPYEGILPMYTGVLFDGKLDPQDITAGIVYLAEQGYIKIRKTEEKVLWVFNTSDYEITLLRGDVLLLPEMLQKVLQLLFTDYIGDAIKRFSFTNVLNQSAPLAAESSSGLPVGMVVKISTLTQKRASNSYIIQQLQASVAKDLEKDGFVFSSIFKSHLTPKQTGSTIFAVIGLLVVSLLFKSIFLASLVCISFGLIVVVNYGRRTAKGYEALNHLQGFKLFLSVTEKERYTFFNAPEKSPELFMKYLPYAIAFKVEKEWSKVFDGITIPNPTWYEGGNLGAFSAVSFSENIGAFSSSFASSSGVSGSSGGGSSGGGGGGGGGGSW